MNGLATRKNERVLALIERARGRGLRWLCPICGSGARCRHQAGRCLGKQELQGGAGGCRNRGPLRSDGRRRDCGPGRPTREAGAGYISGGGAATRGGAGGCAVFEDALAGVEAGRAGSFGWVVGVDRVGGDMRTNYRSTVPMLWWATLPNFWRLMIEPGVFSTDPWSITERTLRLDLLGQTESLFALSNGHIGLRGNLDEGEPHVTPGSYLNGFFELLPMPYAEAGYGYPGARAIADQRDRRQAPAATCRRRAIRCPLRHIAAARADVGPASRERSIARWSGFRRRARGSVLAQLGSYRSYSGRSRRCATRSSRSAIPRGSSSSRRWSRTRKYRKRRDDPRAAAALRAPIESEYHRHNGLDVSLGHRTRTSGLRMAAGLDHDFECPEATATESLSEPNLARVGIQHGVRARAVADCGQIPRPMAGPARGRCRPFATRSMRHSRRRCAQDGTVYWPSSERTSTMSGAA